MCDDCNKDLYDNAYNIKCKLCKLNKGVVYIDTLNNGPWGFLFCPKCDYAHDNAAGPDLGNRVKNTGGSNDW